MAMSNAKAVAIPENLFGYLPQGLLRPLCGANGTFYAGLLEHLDMDILGQLGGIATKKTVQTTILEYIVRCSAAVDLEEDTDIPLQPAEASEGNEVRHLLAYARLMRTGWLLETRDRYRTLVDFDPDARMLLQMLIDLRTSRTRSYGGTVLQVCTLLESAIGNSEQRSANLHEAARATGSFLNDLRRISGALRKVEQVVMGQTEAGGLFGAFFTDFVENFVVSDWKRLNTEHNPFRFRNRVRAICQDLLDDDGAIEAISRGYLRDQLAEDDEDARRTVIQETRSILRTFDSVDDYLDLIDEAKQRIEQRALNTARFMDRFDGGAAARVALAMRTLGGDSTRAADLVDVQPAMMRASLPIGGSHLFQGARRKTAAPRKPLTRRRPDAAHVALQQAIRTHQTRITLTSGKLAAYAEKVLAGGQSSIGSSMRIDDLDDFLAFERLREISRFADGALADRYIAEPLDAVIDNEWIRCRDFVLRRVATPQGDVHGRTL